MAVKKFTTFNTTDSELGRLITLLRSVIDPITSSLILDGQIIDLSLPIVGANTVYHGLDRKPNGFIVIQQSVQADIWWPTTSTDTTMVIRTSAAVTGKAWVF